ncbi:agmatine deiminase family protein [uncultured Campylobacter sp.]|uniref:agmatine deiminase family protein n=1 Tax=uncultured Campylobacter sp. TaxID=218934 RepID=UPI00260F176A|nr:agmatine deiminase family protein [uncultured Campylobacter sp.]
MIRAFGEWEKQEMLLVTLPHENSDWNCYLDDILSSYCSFVKSAAKYQKVGVISPSKEKFKAFLDGMNLSNLHEIVSFEIATNDTWIRDYGAIDVLKDGEIVSYDFGFNAWGGKFDSSLDNSVNKKLFENCYLKGSLEEIDLILEGGSVDFNGEGVLLTTKKCLLNSNRNAKFDQSKIETKLKELFGLKKIIWLERGFIKGDDTDSHIDTLARFISCDTIAYSSCDDRQDEHFDELAAMREELEMSGFKLVALPLPKAKFYKGRRLPATYANFVFVNGALIVPVYGDNNDEIVLDRLQDALPNLEVVAVDATVFIRQNGSLHCSCQNRFALS